MWKRIVCAMRLGYTYFSIAEQEKSFLSQNTDVSPFRQVTARLFLLHKSSLVQ
jgi:hypothetical protein